MNVFDEVMAEREHQDDKWGEQNHDPFVWLAIIGEEYGEACQAALRTRFRSGDWLAHHRMELIQVAASAIAAVECIDRAAAIRAGGEG